MKKNSTLVEHLTISLTILAIFLGVIFSYFHIIKDFVNNPKKYFLTNLTNTELQFFVTYISFVVISILISYVVYLLLTAKTRTELAIFYATKSLANSAEQFVKLYEGAPVPYIILNEKGEIMEPNKAALRFFGVVAEEISGKNLFSYQPEEDNEKIEKIKQYYNSHLPIDREEVRMITKSGEVRWVLLSVFEMKDSSSPEYKGLATLFDITERKELDQAKTAFLSLASHQLRTPVATAKWYIEALLSNSLGEVSEKQKEYLERIYRSNQGMIELIETLLNVSRIETGTLKPDMQFTNVSILTESILEELSPLITKKGLTINKNYGNYLQDIESDPKLLRIVIQNLISNAVKYTKEGGFVNITFKDKSIIISDNGIGIPKKDQEKIFTKLFRAGNTSTLEGTSGTGLGLYLVKSMAETLGGSIHFESEENVGSTFTIDL